MGEVRIRPMREDDVDVVERLTDAVFTENDRRVLSRALPEPQPRSAERSEWWRRRASSLLVSDAGGCWVADLDGEVVGVALSLKRELMWVLATFVVAPGLQGKGVGAALLAVAQDYGKGCLRAMLESSQDVRAVRRYRAAGFHLHPLISLEGVVDRARLPIVEHVREGTTGDRDLMDSLDRRTRGAAHGADHELLCAQHRLLVVDRAAGQGYAYVTETGAPVLLAASDRRTATRLVWEALASSPPDTRLATGNVTAANEWMLDVGLEAGLTPWPRGFLGVRHLKPPAPYLHHGALL